LAQLLASFKLVTNPQFKGALTMRANLLGPLSGASAVLALFCSAAPPTLAASSPTGVWIDHTSRGGVEIKDCGNGNLCGHVVWTKDAVDSKGCGLQILGDVKSVGGNQWDKGWIYSPEKKQKFSVELTPLDDNRLRVKGYKGIKLLSKTMIWHRASGNLQRCDTTTTTKKDAADNKRVTAKADVSGPRIKEPGANSARATTPGIINPAPLPDTRDAAPVERQRTAKVTPTPRFGDALKADPSGRDERAGLGSSEDPSSIYAQPPRADRDDRARRDDDDGERGGRRGMNGLATLLEQFGSEDGIEVGDGYGIKLEKGPNGEKTCRLDVPFVTVNIPCED